MTAEQFNQLMQRFDQVIFLLQVVIHASCFLCGFVSMQMIIHSKNQKHLF